MGHCPKLPCCNTAIDKSKKRIILVRGQNFASGGQIFTGGQNFASGGQIFVSGGQIFVSGDQIFVSGGQIFVSGGQNFASGGQNFVSGSQIFASLGPNSKFKKINFFSKKLFLQFNYFSPFSLSLVSEFDLNFIPR